MSATEAELAALARARELALQGPRGINPQVGAVILSPAGAVLGEGWHRGAGTAHAEVDALAHVPAQSARGATAIVTLEPCNHTGRTGPCVTALIDAGISRVVYGAADEGAISGGGASRLREAAIDVVTANDAASAALIADWAHVQRTGLPSVTVKWAQSLDGRAAAADGTSKWITGAVAREHVHRQRARHDAIAVGTGTVLADDPALTARASDGSLLPAQPLPIVFGSTPVPKSARLMQHPRGLRLAPGALRDELVALAKTGAQRLYVEGGPTLASAFLREGLADEVHVYIAPTLIGGPATALGNLGVATITKQLRLEAQSIERLGDDLLIVASPRKEP